MKAVSDRTAKKRLLALADLLDGLPEGKFDFGTWGSVNKSAPAGADALREANFCGTTACALGWAPSLPFAKRLGFKLEVREATDPLGRGAGFKYAEFTKNGTYVSSEDVAEELFGLGEGAMGYIFHPSVLNRHDESAHGVASAIRAFVNIRFG